MASGTLTLADVREAFYLTVGSGHGNRFLNRSPYTLTDQDIRARIDSIHENVERCAAEGYNYVVGLVLKSHKPTGCPCIGCTHNRHDPLKAESRLVLWYYADKGSGLRLSISIQFLLKLQRDREINIAFATPIHRWMRTKIISDDISSFLQYGRRPIAIGSMN